ncbi:MAG: hypothetical protein HYU66_16620, partial [Armatimonadetes bacterium]|nr:hypothetical protein [Armatimonadota bacterium]
GIAPEIESETAYMVHPFSQVFDRVMRQRAGGAAVQAAGQNYGEFGVTMMTWETGLPETRFDWGPESPSALLSFLPTQLKSRYPIEALPDTISSSLAPTPYFALPPSDESEIRLRRSWLTDKQLGAASTYLGYDIRYRPASNDYFLEDVHGEPIDWLAATRARTAVDVNRICRWAKVTTGDGHQTLYGLNFRGETLVRAVRDGTQYVCFETTYDADGQVTTERKPGRTTQAWLPARGGVRHAYLGIAGYSPAAWRSRLNLVRDTELPETGPVTCYDGRGGQSKIAARHTRYFYEPVFNQPVEVRSLAEDVSGLQRIVYTVRYEFDCDPGDTAAAKAVRAERGRPVAMTERPALDADIRALEQMLAELDSPAAQRGLKDFAERRRPMLVDLARRTDDQELRRKLGEADTVLSAQAAGGRGRRLDRDLVLVRTRLQEALDRLRGLRPILPGIDPGDGQPAGANSCGRLRPDRLILEHPVHPGIRRVIELDWSSHGRLVQWSEQGGEQVLYSYYQSRGVNSTEARNAEGGGPLADVTRPQYDLAYPLTDGPADAPNAELRGPYQWLLPAGTPAASLLELGLPARVSDAIRATANAQSAVQASHLQYRYNVLGEVVRTTRDGAVTLTVCDSLGRRLQRTDPEGLVWTYTYDTDGRLQDLSARDGNLILRARTQWQYDIEGRVTRVKRFRVEGDVVGMTDLYSYNPVGLAASHTDPTGLVTTFTYDALDQLSREDTQAGGTGPILQQIRYSSDDDGSLRRVHYGTDAVRSADGQVSEIYEYDGFGRLFRVGTQRGRRFLLRHSERDELTERLWEFTKEEDQRAAKDRGDDGYAAHERFAYDDHGRRATAQRDGLLFETLVYTPAGRLVSHQVAGGGSRFATCDRAGNEVWSREPDGSQQASLWDPVQRRRFELLIRPNPDGGSPITTCLETQFDRELRPLRQIAYGDGEARETTLNRNGAREVSETLYPDGSVRRAAYDLLGRVELDLVQMHAGDLSEFEPTRYFRDGAGRVTRVTDSSGQDIVYTYDALGRLISERCPGFGQPTRWEYDGHGRVKRRLLPDGAAIRFAYDSRGDLTGETLEGAGGGLLTQRKYDEQGRLTDLLETNRALAALGIPKADIKQQFAYDLLDRPTLQQVAVGNLPGHDVGAAWELQDGGTTWQRRISYPTGAAWLNHYDAAGRLARLERTEGPTAQVDFLYAGDRYAGRDQVFQPAADPLRERRRFNSFGEPVRWSYTALDRGADGSPLHAAWAQAYALGGALPAGPLAELTVARDEMGRTAAVAAAFDHPGLSADGRRRPWRGYGYGPNERLTTLFEADGVPDGFEPPMALPGAGAAAALAGQAGIAAVPFEYVREPMVGGPLGVATIAAEQSRWEALPRGPGHRLREVHLGGQAVTVAHDAAGRVSSEALGGYVWDARGRLIARRAATGAMLAAYAYDGYGRLTAVFQPGGKVQSFVYDGEQIIAAYDAGGTALWDAAWGVDRDHLVEWRDLKTNRVFIPLADERNGIVGVWSAGDGRIVETAEYDPDGRASRYDSGGGLTSRDGGPDLADGLKCGLPFGFGTAFSPPRSGLVYLRNRWYSTRLCQFLSPDPLGYTDSANPYAYAAFDPVNRADPLGLESGGFDAGHALHDAGRFLEGKALDVLSNEPGERPSVPFSVFSYLRKGRGAFLRSEAARVAGARAAGEQAVTGLRNTAAWNALRRGGAAEANRLANVLARTPEKMNIIEFAWAGAKARLFGTTGTAAETAARGLAQAINKAPAYSITPSRMASIVSAVGTPSTASQVLGFFGRAAAPAEAVIRIGWRALTDDPARAGQFHGEPMFHPYARWANEEMIDWYARQYGLPEHDDPYWQQQVGGDPYPSFNAP